MRTLFIDTPVFDGSVIQEISVPNRAILTKATVVNIAGSGTATFTLYNRAFTSDAYNLAGQLNDGNGKVVLKAAQPSSQGSFPVPLPFAVGDTLTVAGSSVGGYNTTHRVTARIDSFNLVTDVSYTSLGNGGTATLAIPTVEKNLYKIASAVASGGVATWEASSWVVLHNADALAKGQSVKTNLAYLDAGAAGSYRASLNFVLPD